MIYKFFLFSGIIFFASCLPDRQDNVQQQIKNLEYSRNDSTGVFDKYMDQENLEIKLKALDAIAKIQNPVHLITVQKILSEPDPRVKEKIIFTLGQIRGEKSAGMLIEAFNKEEYKAYQSNIITALGRTGAHLALNFMVDRLSVLPDSLVDHVITSLCFLTQPDSVDKDLITRISDLINHPSQKVSHAAVYFFSRSPQFYPVENLIRIHFDASSPSNKYRLKALTRIFGIYGITRIPPLLLDSLKTELQIKNIVEKIPWQNQLYQLSLLSYFPDSMSVAIISGYLRDPIPHLRFAAIQALGKINTSHSTSVLLSNYDQAGWNDKGETLLALAETRMQSIQLIIQQNLDKGTLHFKQLLLKALGKTGNFKQVKQFLMVPDRNLVYTAFTELADHDQLKATEVLAVLQSGDLALVASAAEWITRHPESITFDDLETAYSKLSEPADVEAMSSILNAYAVVSGDQDRFIAFLKHVIKGTKSYVLADQVITLLKKAGIEYTGIQPEKKLFLAGEQRDSDISRQVTVKTSKGDIEIELWPDRAPVTVFNFLYLIRKGFYNNVIFHRVVSDFVVQGGDPRGDGWGGPDYNIPCEYNEMEFRRGTVGMATAGKDTGGSQFFICHSEQPHLTGKYTAFGTIVAGMDVVDRIEIEDKIIEITIKP